MVDDWHWIGELGMDWHMIGGLVMDWRIGDGLADWSWIDIGLALHWHRIGVLVMRPGNRLAMALH